MWSLVAIFVLGFSNSGHCRHTRSIDLIAAHSLINLERLPQETTPTGYHLNLTPFPDKGTFVADVIINVTVQHDTDRIVLNSHKDFDLLEVNVTMVAPPEEEQNREDASDSDSFKSKPLPVAYFDNGKEFCVISLKSSVRPGAELQINIHYTGKLFNDTSEGLFRNSYTDPMTKETKWLVAAYLRPNLAQRVFPCYDEPAYKVPIAVCVARHKNMTSTSNMPLRRSIPHETLKDWYWDIFERTPPMATYSLGIVISELSYLQYNISDDTALLSDEIHLRVWGRPDFMNSLVNVSQKVEKSIEILENFWETPFPLPKLDIFALPDYQATKPSDGWGLLLFKESELSGKGTWHITHELVYQWLGGLTTPFWWSDAQVNNALVKYITAYTTLKMNQMNETETFYNNWPMTSLYSIYYEFSKRYPHSKNTAIKQDSISVKTELIFRMINYTLGEETFVRGMQRFIADRQFKTFFGDDIWLSLTEQARFDGKIPQTVTVNEIASSWIAKDRIPVVNAIRNYEDNSITLTQRIYLRERPHDVPDQDKFLWWIPVVLIRQDKFQYSNFTPITWMKREREIKIENMPGKDKFIIINPEEIGPFPVNYDKHNWNLLAQFLCTKDRTKIPVYSRAKLLHDAWNLAYAGDLSFDIALNMTLFLKNEREYLAWDPVFTFIDHIGKHIDSSAVHQKFQTYVRLLLTPLYEELGGEPKEGETDGIAHLRSSSKLFLCQAGYKPCVQEAQKEYNKWMSSNDPDEGNPVANRFICPVFKWGTMEEWEFGLQRVIKFPASRKPSERTYLLKTLAGCPNDPAKIERLLHVIIIEQNGSFSDNDVYLIFSMLSGNANGYATLFKFLKTNWDAIKKRFEEKPQLWNSMVTSATNVFKTQEGLDMVSELYVERQSEFGTADFVIEKALKNIKEETKWSNENLPVIEKWLDEYISTNENKKSR